MNIKASYTNISDVSSASIEPSDSLDGLSLISSNNSSISIVVPVIVVILDRNGKVSISLSSNGSGSPVEDPPLFDVLWEVVSDSESVVVSSNVFVIENSLVSLHC